MRKLLLFLLFILPFVSTAGEPDSIPLLKEDKYPDEDHRNEASFSSSFSAQIISNNLIKVQSTDIASFEVRILNAQNGDLLYEGSTIRGILHITTSSLSEGQYILRIEGLDFKYVGEFEITE